MGLPESPPTDQDIPAIAHALRISYRGGKEVGVGTRGF